MTASPASEAPLIVHVIFRLAIGGLENGLVNLINAMPVSRFRHAVVCIERYTEFRKRIRRDDVQVIEIGKRPGRDLPALWRLFKTLRQLEPDIVHTRNLAALDALLPAVLAGCRHRIHGEHGWNVDDLQGSSRKSLWLRRLHSPLVSHYVAVSRDLRDYLVDRVGVAADRVSLIQNGVDTDRFAPRTDDRPRHADLEAALGRGSCIIGTVGRMDPVKDHVNLAAAFIRLVRDDPSCGHARLAIVGGGELEAKVTGMLRDAGLESRAWLPGPRDDIVEIMASLDVFVQPSLAEGISNTVLEAMASGMPVIATEVGGNPELVEDGRTGVLIPPADTDALTAAMRDYVLNDDLRRRHAAAGRQRAVEALSFGHMLESYIDLYDSRLAGTSSYG